MASLNKVMLIGNLGQDPEIRYTKSQTAVANISIATSERYRAADGQYAERVEWHRVVLWGKTAEKVAKYLRKGSQIHVEGRIQTRSWSDKVTGEKRSATEIVAGQVIFLGGRPGNKTTPMQEAEAADDFGGDPELADAVGFGGYGGPHGHGGGPF